MKKIVLIVTVLILILLPCMGNAEISDIVNSHDNYTILGDNKFWFTTERRHNDHDPTVDCVFCVNDYFISIGLPVFWASNPNNGGGQVKAQIKMSLYEYTGDYNYSISKGPICYAEFLSQGDCPVNGTFSVKGHGCDMTNFQSGASINFYEPMKPGKYIFRVEENSNAAGSHYLVLPMAEDPNYDTVRFLYYTYGKLDKNHTLSYCVKFLNEGEFVSITGKNMSVLTADPEFIEPTPGPTRKPVSTDATEIPPEQTPGQDDSKTVTPDKGSNLVLPLICLAVSTAFLIFTVIYVNKGKKR